MSEFPIYLLLEVMLRWDIFNIVVVVVMMVVMLPMRVRVTSP